MGQRPTKGDKREIRQRMHLTRPPRLEGKVKNAMMYSEKKEKHARKKLKA